MKSLYDALLEQGLVEPPPAAQDVTPGSSVYSALTLSGQAFSQAVLNSDEFKLYIAEGLTERNLPPAVVLRLMDHGWGKPPDRVEHTGKDGNPIETISEVRRVIVHVRGHEDDEHEKEQTKSSYLMH